MMNYGLYSMHYLAKRQCKQLDEIIKLLGDTKPAVTNVYAPDQREVPCTETQAEAYEAQIKSLKADNEWLREQSKERAEKLTVAYGTITARDEVIARLSTEIDNLAGELKDCQQVRDDFKSRYTILEDALKRAQNERDDNAGQVVANARACDAAWKIVNDIKRSLRELGAPIVQPNAPPSPSGAWGGTKP